MPAKGQHLSLEQRIALELGSRGREVTKIARLSNPTTKQRERAVQLGKEMAMLRRGELPPPSGLPGD